MPDLGQSVRLTTAPVDGAGNATTPAGLALSVRLPDGTSVGVAITGPQGGVYVADWTPTQAGRHVARWLSTDGWAYTDTVDVWPADPRMLFNLAEARNALGLRQQRGTSKPDDDVMRLYIAAVTPVIEDIVGPVVPEQRSFTFDGGRPAVLLPGPVLAGSVSVTVDGAASTYFSVNSAAGVVYAGTGLVGGCFSPGRQNVVVTAKVGMTVVPPNIRLAALEEFRFLWQIGQQAAHPNLGADAADDAEWTPAGFAVPRRVIELCGPHQRVGAIG